MQKMAIVVGVFVLGLVAVGHADVTDIPQCEVHCGPTPEQASTRCRSAASEEVGPTGNKGFCQDECTGFLELPADVFVCANECLPTEECHVGVRATESGPACTEACFTPPSDAQAERDTRARRHRGAGLTR